MSTILKTLKKLEEEKSVLDKGLDLKELVLQDEEGLDSPFEDSRKIILTGAFLLGGLALGGFWVMDKPSENQVAQALGPAKEYLNHPVQLEKQSRPPVPHLGIPLSNIPEHQRPQYYKDNENNFKVFAKEAPKSAERAGVNPPSFNSRTNPIINTEQERDIKEIQSLIAAAKTAGDEPETVLIPSLSSNLSIPGLKVKGIIYFSSGSSSNHIFVSTPKNKNQKIRVGDSIESATLMKIESTGAIFSYRGETVRMNIGS